MQQRIPTITVPDSIEILRMIENIENHKANSVLEELANLREWLMYITYYLAKATEMAKEDRDR